MSLETPQRTAAEPGAPRELAPYLVVKDARAAIDFYRRAFGAHLDFELVDPGDGRIGHAELRFGATRVQLADEYPDFGAVGPQRLGGSPVRLHLDVDDADLALARAVQAGALVLRPVKLEFHGNRIGLVEDPFGYAWFLCSRVESVSAEEMQRRWRAMFGAVAD